MKAKKNFIKWIKKNRKWLFSGIGVTIISMLFTVYTKLRNDMDNKKDIPEKVTEASIEVAGDVYGNIYQNSTVNNIKEDNNTQEIIMSESKYLEYLQDCVEGDIVFNHYDDYDGDGSCEMFALVGKKTTDTVLGEGEDLYGKIWYINEDGAREVESEDIEYWTSPHIFTVGDNIFIAFEKAYVSDSQTYIWGVRERKPYQPNISGKINGLKINEYDEIEGIHSTYDAAYDKSLDGGIGHTCKKYYFYYNGRTFKEYGGIVITIDDLSRIPKGKKVIKEVYKHSYEIDSIYYRSNKIININISKENKDSIEYNNITLRYINKKWKIVSPDEFEMDYGSGYYLKAFIPSIATYPNKFTY